MSFPTLSGVVSLVAFIMAGFGSLRPSLALYYRGICLEKLYSPDSDSSLIHSGVKVIDGITIGDGVILGTGAVVNKNIESFTVAVGVPAKVIKQRKA